MGYNESITQSSNEQLLLNLVRLRYRDGVTFLELASVSTQYKYAAGAGASVSGALRNISGSVGGLNGSVAYEEIPTVQYLPLQGSEFAQRMLTPIAPETIVLMSQSGWSIERLLLCCVERLNDLTNGPSASGPTPTRFPTNHAFQEAARSLRRLQSQDLLSVDMRGANPDDLRPTLSFDSSKADRIGLRDEISKAKLLIGLAPKRNEFTISSGAKTRKADEISLKGRSLLGSLYALSHAVDVPADHSSRGFVTVSTDGQGQLPSWRRDFLSNMFGIQVSGEKPSEAFITVSYRNHWFWISDNDLEAKTTFSLLKFLTSLQSAAGKGQAPLLTLSAGG
jgi:hypothetical protein